jgi:hypothetical protein
MKDFECVRKRVGEQSMLIQLARGAAHGPRNQIEGPTVAQLGRIGSASGNEAWALHEELKDG